MTYLLDTSICISVIRRKDPKHLAVLKKLMALSKSSLRLCSIVKAELWVGAEKSQDRLKAQKVLRVLFQEFESIPFDDHAASQYGAIRGILEKSGVTIGSNDLLIAAIALSHNLTVVTHNVKDFSKIPGLKIDDWA
jgi:tRNA(fMet)-specific endonuclease VapC